MKIKNQLLFGICVTVIGIGASCGSSLGNRNSANTSNQNTIVNSVSNSLNSNANTANANAVPSAAIEAKEPDQYQATVKIKFEATGNQQTTALPAISANVAKNGSDRMMEIVLPTSEKIVYINKNNTNYAVLPNRKQYAELTPETVGFDARQLLMPDQIVQQVKSLQGFNLVGEENVNGRTAVKYSYQAAANTQSQAGTVETQSFVLVDKETGLPLHSETVSQSQSGGNVQGYNGLRLSTDLTDIKTAADSALFVVPTEYQKIDDQQIRAQADLLFKVAGTYFAQMMQAEKSATPNANTANTANSANSSVNQAK